MSLVRYNLTARNGGVPTAGLSPTWSTLVVSSTAAAVSSPNTAVPITALAGGGYQVAYDPTTQGELYGIIDFGASISDPNERYADITLDADPSTIATIPTGVNLNLAQAVPVTGNTANSTADCLNASRAGNFGKQVLAGTAYTVYGPDGVTVARTFTLDSATAPTTRA